MAKICNRSDVPSNKRPDAVRVEGDQANTPRNGVNRPNTYIARTIFWCCGVSDEFNLSSLNTNGDTEVHLNAAAAITSANAAVTAVSSSKLNTIATNTDATAAATNTTTAVSTIVTPAVTPLVNTSTIAVLNADAPAFSAANNASPITTGFVAERVGLLNTAAVGNNQKFDEQLATLRNDENYRSYNNK